MSRWKGFCPPNLKEAKPRLIVWDCETSLAKGYFFGKVWETNIVEVIEQSFMLSFSYKVLGEKQIYTYALPDFSDYKRDKHSDSQLLKKLHEVLSSADILIHHNGNSFDVPTANTRMLFHDLVPPPPFKTIDTCKEARRVLKLPSNKLDDIGEYFGLGRKLAHTGKHLWLACMNGDLKAFKEMKNYNEQDVVLLEKVYLKLRPFIKHPNINIATRTMGACPKCGSKDLQHRGFAYTRTSESPRLWCKDCGGWSLGKKEPLAKKIHIT